MATASPADTPHWHVWESDLALCPPVERMREMTPAHTSCLGASLAKAGRWEDPWRIFKGGPERNATADGSRAQQEAQAEEDGREDEYGGTGEKEPAYPDSTGTTMASIDSQIHSWSTTAGSEGMGEPKPFGLLLVVAGGVFCWCGFQWGLLRRRERIGTKRRKVRTDRRPSTRLGWRQGPS